MCREPISAAPLNARRKSGWRSNANCATASDSLQWAGWRPASRTRWERPSTSSKAGSKCCAKTPDAQAEKRARNLEIIGAQAGAITDIVRQLLTLARPFNLRREAVEPPHLIAAVVELIEADAEKSGVRVEVPRNDHHSDFVEGDPALLRPVSRIDILVDESVAI